MHLAHHCIVSSLTARPSIKVSVQKTAYVGVEEKKEFDGVMSLDVQLVYLVSCPDLLFHRTGKGSITRKGRSGNSCTVFVCSRGICIEPMGCEMSCDIDKN